MDTKSDDQNQMIKHLKKQIQEDKKNKQSLMDENDEHVKLIGDKNNEIRKLLKEMKKKDDKLSVFEEEFEINYDETISVRDSDRDKAHWFKAEMAKHSANQLKTEEILKNMEKKREISDRLLKTLQMENSNLKIKLKETHNDKTSDIEKLMNEIEMIQKINQDKETSLDDIQNEKEKLEAKFQKLERENEKLRDERIKRDSENQNEQSLGEELGMINPRLHNVSPASDQCNTNFKTEVQMKTHEENYHTSREITKKIWKLKEQQLDQTINSQKLKLASEILFLRESEVDKVEFCTCKSFCRIVHQKHNYTRSVGKEIFKKFKALENSYSCDNCDKTFKNVDCLKWHMKSTHVQGNFREEFHGGVIVRNPSIPSGGRLLEL